MTIQNLYEELERLYCEIDTCKRCPLGSLDVNQPPRLRFKAGMKPILIVGQNPSTRKDPTRNYVWGGLDALFHYSAVWEIAQKVWITNLIKCVFEGNKAPRNVDEIISTCSRWLKKEIDIIQPRRIVGLGKLSCGWLRKEGYNILELPHPAYVSRFKFRDCEVYISKLKEALLEW